MKKTDWLADKIITKKEFYFVVFALIIMSFTDNYTKDKFALNPLLKQTITRIISLDSQYRDNKSTVYLQNIH